MLSIYDGEVELKDVFIEHGYGAGILSSRGKVRGENIQIKDIPYGFHLFGDPCPELKNVTMFGEGKMFYPSQECSFE